jgi:hypothetical protein
MTTTEAPLAVSEAVGVFSSAETLQAAIDELLQSGFHRAALGLLASEHAIEEKLGHWYPNVGSLADNPKSPRASYVSPEAIGDAEGALIGLPMYVGAMVAAGAIVASGGSLVAIVLGAALSGSAGGLLGSLFAQWVGEHHARHVQQQVDRGGLILWVRTRTRAEEERAIAILEKHSGEQVHIHGLPLEA